MTVKELIGQLEIYAQDSPQGEDCGVEVCFNMDIPIRELVWDNENDKVVIYI